MSSRLERLLKLDAYLLGSKYPSLRELCNALDASPRTVYMDLRDLRDRFGRNIQFCKTNHGYYNAKATASLPCPSASDEDISLLLAAVEMIAQLTGPRVKARLIGVLSPLCGDRLAPLSKKIADRIFVSENKAPDNDQRFIHVLGALLSQQQLCFNDHERGEIKLNPPFSINLEGAQWVVSGYDSDTSLRISLEEIDLEKTGDSTRLFSAEQAN